MLIGNNADDRDERLILALAEQLKHPLTQIARQAELANKNSLAHVENIASNAIRLIDNYLLTTMVDQQSLELESVSVSEVLYDVSQQLQPIAKQYNCDIELSLAGKYGPVMAHKQSLSAALFTLGHNLIESQPQDQKNTVVVAGYRSSKGIVAGVFGQNSDAINEAYRRTILKSDKAAVLSKAGSSNNTGVYIAELLFRAMSSGLRVAHHKKLVGLAGNFLPSSQLRLV